MSCFDFGFLAISSLLCILEIQKIFGPAVSKPTSTFVADRAVKKRTLLLSRVFIQDIKSKFYLVVQCTKDRSLVLTLDWQISWQSFRLKTFLRLLSKNEF